tara:strand:- start:246 stop:575 length:330 start_codon:yes stop_codon:yes gene_type:complete
VLSSKREQSTSTACSWSEPVLTEKEVKKAKKVAVKELLSLPLFVKNGLALHSNGSAHEKVADEELVRTALTSIQDMPITQSSIAILISALHKVAMEAKWDCLIDIQEMA